MKHFELEKAPGLIHRLSQEIFTPKGIKASTSIQAEESFFVRINQGQLRQNGVVEELSVDLSVHAMDDNGKVRSLTSSFNFPDFSSQSESYLRKIFTTAAFEVLKAPSDPFAELPDPILNSSHDGRTETSIEQWMASFTNLGIAEGWKDCTGFFQAGPQVSMVIGPDGHFRRFDKEGFHFSYLLPAKQATSGIKREIAGLFNDFSKIRDQLAESARWKADLEQSEERDLPRGAYRVYLEPQAVREVLDIIGYGISEQGRQQGISFLAPYENGQPLFSDKVTIQEDFNLGLAPRFNGSGELSPATVALVQSGALVGGLANKKTAKEYSIPSNGAEDWETPRSLHLLPGTLGSSEKLKALGTGLWISNLHYLNWSDERQGRITGMTRFACFWIENGKPVYAVKPLRFDVRLQDLLGADLESLTNTAETFVEPSTYGMRAFGGCQVPGALLKKMEFTL